MFLPPAEQSASSNAGQPLHATLMLLSAALPNATLIAVHMCHLQDGDLN
jgi:hypothetical protein